MRGTDMNEQQMKAAEHFILENSHGAPRPPNGQVLLAWEQFVRIVAWYGAMRYMAGRDGINSLENPGLTFKTVAGATPKEGQ